MWKLLIQNYNVSVHPMILAEHPEALLSEILLLPNHGTYNSHRQTNYS